MLRGSHIAIALILVALGALLPVVAAQPDSTVPPEARRHMLSMPRPEYPHAARPKRLHGRGYYELTFDLKTGMVTRVRVSESTGSKLLDDTAISALSRWRARPGHISRMRVPFNFVPPP